jgi:hypothetical protein
MLELNYLQEIRRARRGAAKLENLFLESGDVFSQAVRSLNYGRKTSQTG